MNFNICHCSCHSRSWEFGNFCECDCDSSWKKENFKIYGSIPLHEVVKKMILLEARLDQLVDELKSKSQCSNLSD